jgi:uncharacterized protein (DUF736 family)
VVRLAQSGLAVFGTSGAQGQFDARMRTLRVAVTASVVGDLEHTDDGLPRLARPVPRTGIAAGSVATGFATPIPVKVDEPQRTVPLVATTYPRDGEGGAAVVPSLALAGVLAAEGTDDSAEVRIEGGKLAIGERDVIVEDDGRVASTSPDHFSQAVSRL